MTYDEIWLPFAGPHIVLSEFYEVSNYGRIYDKTANRLIRWNDTKLDPPSVVLARGIRVSVPHLVLYAFVGAPEANRTFALHRNDNKLDNRWPENLYWGSYRDNTADRIRNARFRNHGFELPRGLTPLVPFVLLNQSLPRS